MQTSTTRTSESVALLSAEALGDDRAEVQTSAEAELPHERRMRARAALMAQLVHTAGQDESTSAPADDPALAEQRALDIWARADAQARRQAPHLYHERADQTWQLAQAVEALPPNPDVSHRDRALADRLYQYGRLMIAMAAELAAGNGDNPRLTLAGRPVKIGQEVITARRWGLEAISQLDKSPLLDEKAQQLDRDDQILYLKPRLARLFALAKRFERWGIQVLGKPAWARERDHLVQRAKQALIRDTETLAMEVGIFLRLVPLFPVGNSVTDGTPGTVALTHHEKAVAAVLKKALTAAFQQTKRGGAEPSELVRPLIAKIVGASEDAVHEGAGERSARDEDAERLEGDVPRYEALYALEQLIADLRDDWYETWSEQHPNRPFPEFPRR